MNEITINNVAGQSLEDMLITLARHGAPSIMQHDDGTWSCKINMRVASEGVSFDVRSDFKQKTPSAAATQCFTRMIDTLAKYGVRV